MIDKHAEAIFYRLQEATEKSASEIFSKILVKTMDNAAHPHKWPIDITDDVRDIYNCTRIFEKVLNKLDGYGFILHDGMPSHVSIDLLDIEFKQTQDIPESQNMLAISKNNISARYADIFNFMFEEINREAQSGLFRVEISLVDSPLNGNDKLIKMLIKNLMTKGYVVKTIRGEPINTESRPDYKKIGSMVISWGG